MRRLERFAARYGWLCYVGFWLGLLILVWWLRRPEPPVVMALVQTAPPNALSHNPFYRP